MCERGTTTGQPEPARGSLFDAVRLWAWSLVKCGPIWTLRHVKVFGGLK